MKKGIAMKKDIRIGLSTYALQRHYGDKEAIRIAKDCGADAIDFSFDLPRFNLLDKESIYSKNDQAIVEYFSGLKSYAEELGIEICQTHGRSSGFKNILEEDENFVKNARLDLLATKALGAPVCVIHAVTTIYMGPDCDAKLMRDLNFEMFTKLLPYAKEYGVKLATETFGDAVKYNSCDFFGNIEEFIKSYQRVKANKEYAEYFTICVDTGHSNKAMRFGNPTPADVIRMLGREITTLHLNDNDTFVDQHKMPKTGTIDWEDVLDALEEVRYEGCYNLELALDHFGEELMIETAEFAVKVMRHMLEGRNKKC